MGTEKKYASRLEWLKDNDPEEYEKVMKSRQKEWVRLKVPKDVIGFAETRYGNRAKGLRAMLIAQKNMAEEPEGKGARNALKALLRATQGSGGLISYNDMMNVIGNAIGTKQFDAVHGVLSSLMKQRYITKEGKNYKISSVKQPDPVLQMILGGGFS